MNRSRPSFLLLTMSAVFSLSACADDPVAVPGTITVSAAPATVSVPVEGNGSVAVTVARGGGCAGPISLALTGRPAGVTGSWSANPVAAGATSATLTLTAGATAAVGTAPLTVRASGSGVIDATTSLSLAVTPKPAITLTVTNPAPIPSLAVPTGAQVSIALTRIGGFTGTVTMSAEGLPSGWTASFSPASITTGSGTLATITPPANPARGSYPVTFRATATGVAAATGTATITVQ